MTMRLKGLFLLLFIMSSGALFAQQPKMFHGDNLEKVYILQERANVYASSPKGALEYRFEGARCLAYLAGTNELFEGISIYRYEKSNNRIDFYKDDELAAYYVPSEERFYYVSGKGEYKKEEVMGVLFEGILYDQDMKPRFAVDADFPIEATGIFLLMVS